MAVDIHEIYKEGHKKYFRLFSRPSTDSVIVLWYDENPDAERRLINRRILREETELFYSGFELSSSGFNPDLPEEN